MGAFTAEDRILILVIAAVTAGVFVLDLLTPLGISIWALYVLPLGALALVLVPTDDLGSCVDLYRPHYSGLFLLSSRCAI